MLGYMDAGVHGCWCIWLCGMVGKIPVEWSKGALRRAFAGFSRDLADHATKPYTPTSIYPSIHIPQHSKPLGIPFPGVGYSMEVPLKVDIDESSAVEPTGLSIFPDDIGSAGPSAAEADPDDMFAGV